MKRHFLPFFGHFTNIRLIFLKMQGNCNPADNMIPIEIQIEYVYSLHSKSKAAINMFCMESSAKLSNYDKRHDYCDTSPDASHANSKFYS